MTPQPTTAPPPAERPIRVLLVDDQPIVGEAIRQMLAGEPDIALEYCQDPAQAIPTAGRVQPTVILQDLVMPDVDGLVLVKFFRANKATRETPMVVLSSKEDPAVKAQAFTLGANDYLVKLPDKLELIARVRYHSRSYQTLLERNEAYRQLAESQRRLAEEVAQAARYVESILPPRLTGPVRIDWKYVPSTDLAGDMFGYHWLDPDHLALYVLDVSGHGIGSSLLAVSAANVLAAQSLASTDFRDPGQVLARLNDVFQMEKQDGKYFTMWYGVFRRPDRTLLYAGAGHPPALLYTGPAPGQTRLTPLEGGDPMVGLLPPGVPFETRSARLDACARLLIYTDGVYEIQAPGEPMWKLSDFLKFMADFPLGDGPVADRLYEYVRGMHGPGPLEDDFSLLDVQL